MTDSSAWCIRLGAALVDTADGVGVLAGRVARDWSDAEGRVRADRLSMVHRSLLRTADDASALGTALERAGAPAGDLAALLTRLAAIGAAVGGGATSRRDGGMALGATDAERAGEEPGMQLPGIAD